MKAEIEIECKNPKDIIKVLKPEISKGNDASKFDVVLKDRRKKLYIGVSAKNISALLAGINSYLRLIRSILEIEDLSD